MTAHELFALPARTRVRDSDTGTLGTVAKCDGRRVVIAWDGGDTWEFGISDEYAGEFAGLLELAAAGPG